MDAVPARPDKASAPRGHGSSVAKALVITEKPSVARDIAAALGGFTEHEGYSESERYVVSFAVGHLFELLEPEEIDPKYKRWLLDDLPILPEEFHFKPKSGQAERIRTLKKLIQRRRRLGGERLRRGARGRAHLPR